LGIELPLFFSGFRSGSFRASERFRIVNAVDGDFKHRIGTVHAISHAYLVP
jgi:hypothetical protein